MTPRARQSGISLIVGLIMLILITLLVVTSFNISSSHLIVVNNAQVQTELEAAANAAVEKSISYASTSTSSFTDPSYLTGVDIKVGQFEGAADGTPTKTEVTVNVKASCEKARTLSNKEAQPVSVECIWDPDTGGAYIEGKTSAANDSLCAEALWDIAGSATAPHDNRAKTEIHQGIVVNVSRTVTSNCGS